MNIKSLLSNLINFSLIFSLLSFVFFKKDLGIFFLILALMFCIISIFVITLKSKKIYFLIVILISILTYFAYTERQKQNIIQEKNRLEKITLEEKRLKEIKKQSIFNLDSSISDIYVSIKNGEDKSFIVGKAYAIISGSKNAISASNTKSYLDLAKAYEVASLVGVTGASDLALTNYNKYCELESKDSTCYISLAKFLLLDNTKKKEALRIIKLAIPLAKDEAEIKNINEIIKYISNLK